MNTIDNDVVDKTHDIKKKDFKREDESCLKINICDEDSKAYLSGIDDMQLRKFSIMIGLENYIFKLKKKVNKFYFIYAVSTLIHFFIYVNRGILPASYDYLSTFIKETYDTTNVDKDIGYLTSIFVFGLSINSVISGSLGSSFNVFKLTDIFLLQNAVALFITGFSFIIGSYYALIFSRFYCGFSEAAFITVIPPLIYAYSKNRVGSWISIFIVMFPLGGCTGSVLAAMMPSLNITIPQYFISSALLFFIFFIYFYLFDENLLKQYEDKKSLKEKKKENKEKYLEEGNQLIEENNSKEGQISKNNEKLKDDNNTTADKTNNQDIEACCIPLDLNEENKIKDNKQNKIKEKKVEENNIINEDLKKEKNIIIENKEADLIRRKDLKKKKSNSMKEKKKEEIQSINNNDNFLYTNNRNLRKLKNKNLYKNRSFKNEHLKLKFSESKNISSLKNFTNIKHISCVKRINSYENSKNKYSTDYSDHKSLDGSFKLSEKKKLKLDDEEVLYNDERNMNELNSTFNSIKKKDSDNDFYINKNKIENNNYSEKQNLNNNYINNHSDNMCTMDTYKDNLCLTDNQELFNKNKNENNFLDIKQSDNLEILDDDNNKDKFNLGIFAKVTFLNPSFLLLVIALTAHADIIQCYLVYGPAILYALDIFPTYKNSTIICSVCACVSSIIGSCLGGFLMDMCDLNIKNIDKNYEHMNNNEKKVKLYKNDILVYKYLRIIGLQTFINLFFSSIFILACSFIENKYLFILTLTLGLIFMFSSMPGHNIGVMVCVPQNLRPFSIGMSSFMSHILGDIPWVVITGIIKGTLSPNCSITTDEKISELCREQRWGLRVTLLIMCSKTPVMALASLYLYLYSNKKIKKYANSKDIKV